MEQQSAQLGAFQRVYQYGYECNQNDWCCSELLNRHHRCSLDGIFPPHKENPAKLLNRNISVALEQQKNIYGTELEWHQL